MKKLNIVYSIDSQVCADQPSIFLAGPTVRREEISWRQAALYYLSLFEYEGAIFVPEPSPGKEREWSYREQVDWEETHLQAAKCIMFWIPRNMKDMLGLTTNIEWGVWQKSGKVVLGYPVEAEKMEYLAYYAQEYGVPKYITLEQTVSMAINTSKGNK